MLDMSGIPIYLLPGYSDLRRGINGFVSVITNIMEMDVTQGGLYIFCGKRRDSIKCVMWDKTGFLLLQKKLVGGYTFMEQKNGYLVVRIGVYRSVDEWFNTLQGTICICTLIEQGGNLINRGPTRQGIPQGFCQLHPVRTKFHCRKPPCGIESHHRQ